MALLLLLAACASPSAPEADSSSESEATTAVTSADGADGVAAADGADGADGEDGRDGADGVGTAGAGGAGGAKGSSGGGGVDPDDKGGRVGSPLYIEPIQAFGGPGSGFVTDMEDNCAEAKAGPSCIALTFEPADKVDDETCKVSRTDPDVQDKKIAVGTNLTVYLECPEPPEETTDPPEGEEG